MNKIKPFAAALSHVIFNLVVVVAMVALASLIGVGGAALWIYSRPATQAAARPVASHLRPSLAANDEGSLPKLTPVQVGDDSLAQLTPARYVPTTSEIATLSDKPRYTYVSYNGGRQQAHLRVNTVLSTASAPAPLTAAPPAYDNDLTPAQASGNDYATLSDPSSHYITNAQGRVIGIDGTAGAAEEARAQRVAVVRAASVPPKGLEPEVRVAAPVVVRKATPVDDEETSTSPMAAGEFSAQAELSRVDERPVLRAQPVIHASRQARPGVFGASDDFRSFGSSY